MLEQVIGLAQYNSFVCRLLQVAQAACDECNGQGSMGAMPIYEAGGHSANVYEGVDALRKRAVGATKSLHNGITKCGKVRGRGQPCAVSSFSSAV